MSILILRLPEVKAETVDRPKTCLHCGAATLQRWATVEKPVRDTSGCRRIRIHRYRCTVCQRTFRHYPTGVTAAEQTDRFKVVVAMMWGLGLSLRSVTAFVSAFGVTVCHQTVWRDAVELGKALRRRKPHRVRVLGVDGTGARIAGRSSGVVVAVDMGTGEPVAFVELDEHDAEAVTDWLAPLVEQLGVEVMVTDDLSTYRRVAAELDIDHQTCVFHVKRWVFRALMELAALLDEEWLPTLEDVWRLLTELPADGGYQLFRCWEQIDEPPPREGEQATPLYRLRLLLIRLSNTWHDILLYKRRPGVPATNNRTESAIGRYKTRTRTMRGVKSALGRETMFALCHAGLLS